MSDTDVKEKEIGATPASVATTKKTKESSVYTKKITNPLTVIGLFAGLSEAAITTVTALSNSEVQGTFIWFVIGFPVLLVLLFFYTLLKRSEVLYAPSDYKDEEHFLEAMKEMREKQREKLESILKFIDEQFEESKIVNRPPQASSRGLEKILLESDGDESSKNLNATDQAASLHSEAIQLVAVDEEEHASKMDIESQKKQNMNHDQLESVLNELKQKVKMEAEKQFTEVNPYEEYLKYKHGNANK